VVRDDGRKERQETFVFNPARHVGDRQDGLERTAQSLIEKKCAHLGNVPGSLRHLRQDLPLESPVAFAEVVDERQKAEPRRLHLIQIDQPAGPSQTPAEVG
jgi:hypothetical protein